MALAQPARERLSDETPARAVISRNVLFPWFRKTGIVSLESAVWKMSGLPSSSRSRASAPMPDSGRPASGYATPAMKPISSNFPLPRLRKR